jgi:hypothetical protein
MKKKNRIWIYVSLAVGLLVKVGIFILIIAGRGKGKQESQNIINDPVNTTFKTVIAGSVTASNELPEKTLAWYAINTNQLRRSGWYSVSDERKNIFELYR